MPGWTIRGGKLVRMDYKERRDRKLGAQMAQHKKAAKLQQTIRKAKISKIKRGALGL